LSQWKFVILPEFSLKTFAKSNSLSKKNKRLLAALSHGAFRDKLKLQLSMRGNCLLDGGEDWSTKLCHNCSHLNYPGISRTYSCSRRECKVKVRRYTNGAANILAFTLARIIKWLRQKALLLGTSKADSAPVSILI
jgi:transposase